MDSSILDTVKESVGVNLEETGFDKELIVYINSAITSLYRLGVGTDPTFFIKSNEETFSEFIPDSQARLLSLVKMYLRDKVNLQFDISTSSSMVIQAIKEDLSEVEWSIVNSGILLKKEE